MRLQIPSTVAYPLLAITAVLALFFFWQAYRVTYYNIQFQDLTARTEGTVTKFDTVLTSAGSPVRTAVCPIVEYVVNGEKEKTSDAICGALRVHVGDKLPVAYNPRYSNEDNIKDGHSAILHPWFKLPYSTLNYIYKGLIFLVLWVVILLYKKRDEVKDTVATTIRPIVWVGLLLAIGSWVIGGTAYFLNNSNPNLYANLNLDTLVLPTPLTAVLAAALLTPSLRGVYRVNKPTIIGLMLAYGYLTFIIASFFTSL